MTGPGGEPPATRGFSLGTATFVIVSSTVGSGVLTTSGYVALDLGSHSWMLLAWVLGGVIAACGAFTLAELSASLPRSGGEFVILGEAYGPLIGFLGGWVSLLMGFVAPIAATAWASADYFLSVIGPARFGTGTVRLVASGLVVLLAMAHASGRSRTAAVQGVATVSTLAMLVTFVIAGLVAASRTSAIGPALGPIGRPRPSSLFVSLVFISYSYTGWNAAAYVAGEIEDPQKRLPRAIGLGTWLVVVLYLGLNLVYALAVPMAELRRIAATEGRESVEKIAEIAADRLFPARAAGIVTMGCGLVLLASLSALIVTGPRVASAMARDGRLPSWLARETSRGRSPAIATAFVALGSLMVLWAGAFEQIVFASGVALGLCSLMTVSAVFVLRRTRPGLPRPFRVPLYPIVPSVFVVFTALSLGFSLADSRQRWASVAGLGIVAAGVPAYFASKAARS